MRNIEEYQLTIFTGLRGIRVEEFRKETTGTA